MPRTEPLTASVADLHWIGGNLDRFWGDEPAPWHHPMFVREFAGLSLAVRDDTSGVVAYLFGVMASAEPVGYVHIVGVREDHRRHGLGAQLYDEFASRARRHGATSIRAITRPSNARSVDFHAGLGFTRRLVEDYAALGEPRYVFERPIV